MKHVDYARRKSRGGKGLIPPNPTQWENEHNGLDVREAAGVSLDQRLPIDVAYELVPSAEVVPHGSLLAAQSQIDHFRNGGSAAWSGMAVPLPDGDVMVVFNDSHPPTRTRATLMEEFFHLWLGHPPSQVRVYGAESRTYNAAVETSAYGSGAAALLPYAALRSAIQRGWTVADISNHFEISEQLVGFRAKVTKQYQLLGRGRRRRTSPTR